MSEPFWRDGFGPMLPGTEGVDFGDLDRLEEALATRKFAAFILEPVQSEGGIQVPEDSIFAGRAGALPQIRDALRAR